MRGPMGSHERLRQANLSAVADFLASSIEPEFWCDFSVSGTASTQETRSGTLTRDPAGHVRLMSATRQKRFVNLGKEEGKAGKWAIGMVDR